MKVLWFSNTPAMGINFLNKDSQIKGTGGWIYSLNKVVESKVELSIAFHFPYKRTKFKYGETVYYPIFTGNIIIQNLKKRFLGSVYDDEFLNQYLNVIEEVKPDIIHIHGTENSFLCLLGLINIPIVISIQGNLNVVHHRFLMGFNGQYLNYRNFELSINSLLFGSNNFNKQYSAMGKMALIEEKYFKLAKNVIGRTEWDRRISRVLAPHSNYFIGNEILRDNFYNSIWNNLYTTGKIILFSTNGNTYYKGFETICHALSILNNLNYNVEWRVAGVSENSLINIISRKYLGTKYPRRGLKLLGSLGDQELINNLLQANIYVMSSHIENSPNNLCEAMILGIPCVSTSAGGTPSILADNLEGLLVQDGDPWAMAGAILELVNDPVKSSTFSINARKKALERHNQESIVNGLVNIYQQIIIDSNKE